LAEREELQLVVTLDDQASASLEKLKAAMQALGSGSQATTMERLRRQNLELVSTLKGVREESERMVGMTASLTRGLNLVGGAVAAVVGATLGVRGIKQFAESMIELKSISLQTGFSIGQIKGAIDGLEQSGIGRGTAIASIKALSNTLFDLTKMSSQVRQEMMKSTSHPEAMAMLLNRLTGFANAGALKGGITAVFEAYNNIVANETERTKSKFRGLKVGEAFLAGMGLSPEMVIAAHNAIKDLSDAQIEALDRAAEEAEKFNLKWVITKQQIGTVTQAIQTQLMKAMNDYVKSVEDSGQTWDEYVNKEIEKTIERLKSVVELWTTVGKFVAQPFTGGAEIPGAPAAPPGFWEKLNPFNPANIEREQKARENAGKSSLNLPPTGGTPYTGTMAVPFMGGLSSAGGGGRFDPMRGGREWESLSGGYSSNIEDRRNEIIENQTDMLDANKDSLSANTDELKRLNDFLMTTTMGGAPTGALGFLGTQAGGLQPGLGGGTGVAGPIGGPMGALPGLGGGGGAPGAAPGGAPGGGGAPGAAPGGAPGGGGAPGAAPGGAPGGGGAPGPSIVPGVPPSIFGGVAGGGIAGGIAGLPGGPSGPALRGLGLPPPQLGGGFGGGAGGGVAAGVQGLPGGPSGPAVRGPGGGLGGLGGGGVAGIAGLPGGPSGPAVRGPGPAGGAGGGAPGGAPGGSAGGTAGAAAIGGRGASIYNKLKAAYEQSGLVGTIPAGGERFGFKTGSADEWARFGTAVANAESSFNPKTRNTSDPGGSFGIFQYAHGQVPGGNAFDVDASVAAFVRDSAGGIGRGSILARRFSTIGSHPERTIGRLGQGYKLDSGGGVTATAAPSASDSLDSSLSMLGLNETRDRTVLKNYLAKGSAGVDPKDVPWCAAFVNANLAAAGVQGTGSAAARSFLKWGQAVNPDSPILKGDVLVQPRGRDPALGHVGQATGVTRMGKQGEEVEMVAGNVGGQAAGGGEVRRYFVPRSSLIGVRRAGEAELGTATAERQRLEQMRQSNIAVPQQQAVALDRTAGRELDKTPSVNVNGSGKISVEVKAPAGTKAGANGDGLFKKTEITRQVQMEPAASGPPAIAANGGED
jgi:hypothetical protein